MYKNFNFLLTEDVCVNVSVWYREDSDGDFYIKLIEANTKDGANIYDELKHLYVRDFCSTKMSSLADKIVRIAEKYWDICEKKEFAYSW